MRKVVTVLAFAMLFGATAPYAQTTRTRAAQPAASKIEVNRVPDNSTVSAKAEAYFEKKSAELQKKKEAELQEQLQIREKKQWHGFSFPTVSTARALPSPAANVALPWTDDFSTANNWTITDNNADGKTWYLQNGGMRYDYSETHAADDWLISADKFIVPASEITIKFTYSKGSYEEILKVYYGTSSSDLSSFTLLDTKTYTTPVTGTYKEKFTLPAGNYHIAIQCVSKADMFWIAIDNFEITDVPEPVIPFPLPFTDDFSTADNWTIVDHNIDGRKWLLDEGVMHYAYSSYYDADDWLVTARPVEHLGGDITMSLEYRVQSASYPESFELWYGTGSNVDNMTLFGCKTNVTNTSFVTYSSGLTLPAGNYYFAIRATSPADRYYLYVDNVSITATTPPAGIPELEVVRVVPPMGACSLGSAETLQVEVKNNGTGASSSSYTVSWSISHDGNAPLTGSAAMFNSIGACGTVETLQIPATFDFSADGKYDMEITVTDAADTETSNNSASATVIKSQPVSIPYQYTVLDATAESEFNFIPNTWEFNDFSGDIELTALETSPLLTRCLPLTAGKIYEFTLTRWAGILYYGMMFYDSYDILIGEAGTDISAWTILKSYVNDYTGGDYARSSIEFTVPASGNWQIAILPTDLTILGVSEVKVAELVTHSLSVRVENTLEAPLDAHVKLEAGGRVYEGDAAGGTLAFPAVAEGTYDYTVSIAGYNSKTGAVTVDADKTLTVTLDESQILPYALEVEVTGASALFSWNKGGDSFAANFEDGTADAFAQFIQGDGYNADGYYCYWRVNDLSSMIGNYEGSFAAYCGYSSPGYPNNSWLITPALRVVADSKLQFALATSYTYTVGAGKECLLVKARESGQIEWTTIWKMSDRGIFDDSYSYSLIEVDLGAYADKAIEIAFNAVDEDGDIVAIDAVKVGVPGVNMKSLNLLQHYEVFLDGQSSGTTASKNYHFTNLVNGQHKAGVRGVYETGNTATVEINFDVTNGIVLPVLVGTSPANGATDVALDAVITVTFDKAVEANDLSAISLKDATATLPVTAGISGAVLTITPADGLSAGTLYTVKVPGGTIKNYDADIEFSFTTKEAEVVAPVLVGTSPANGATDVALDAVITVTFDKAVEANDLSAISLKDATATLPITAGVSGAVLTITPAAGLSAGTLYTVKVPGGTIKNYDTDIEFSFTTLTSGIGSISVNLVRVSQQGDYLVITGSKPGDVITVYNVTGMKIISTADTVIPVSKTGKGVFIVNTGSQNSKVILQ